MRNYDVAHLFFYSNKDFSRRSMTVSFYAFDRYFSYGTCIGQFTNTIEGQRVLIISDNTFSNTTAKHIGELRGANPSYKVYYLPQRMGSGQFYPFEVLSSIKQSLKYASIDNNLKFKDNRITFLYNYKKLNELLELEIFEPLKAQIKEVKEYYKALFDNIHNEEYIKELKRNQRRITKEESKEAKEFVNNFFNTNNYLECLYNIFRCTNRFTYKQRQLFDKVLNPSIYSYVWLDLNTNKVESSRYIRIDIKEAYTMLKLWKHNKLRLGMKLDKYTVLEIKENHVKIGCHIIPTKNLEELYSAISNLEEFKQVA